MSGITAEVLEVVRDGICTAERLQKSGLRPMFGVSLDTLRKIETLAMDLNKLRAEWEATLGVGDGSSQFFVHGKYDAIKEFQRRLIEGERKEFSYTEEQLRMVMVMMGVMFPSYELAVAHADSIIEQLRDPDSIPAKALKLTVGDAP